MSSESDPILSKISKKLDIVIRLLALSLVRNTKVQKEQIALLSDAGFQPKQIADILGTTSNTVRVALHSIRKEREPRETKEEITTETKSKAPAEKTEGSE